MFHNDLKNLVDDKIPAAFVFFALLLFADHLCNSAIFVFLAKWKQKTNVTAMIAQLQKILLAKPYTKLKKKSINDTSK